MNTGAKSIFIGSEGSSNLFKTLGFEAFAIDNISLPEILGLIESQKEMLGIIIISSEVELSTKHQKFLNSLHIPILTIPTDATYIDLENQVFEQIVERAIGMKIDTSTK